jgi:thiamine pyrophosphate-dependent acetolactate synthase large subunit-like protein
MQRMTGGRAVVESLRVEGIEHVFGVVGTHNVHLFDGLFDEPAIRAITTRHEQGASLMATGYARASGRIAACFTVPGPGVTNALTGLGMAYSESTPLLLVAGQNPLAMLERERGIFHELPNSLSVAGSLTGFATRVSEVTDIPSAVRHAIRVIRYQRPRPAYIEVPLEVLANEAEVQLLPPESFTRPGGNQAAIDRGAQVLREASRPIVFAGGGVASAQAGDQLRRVAERLRAPVLTSAYAKGVIPEDHPLALGDGWGRLDDLYAEVLDRSDAALVVGARFDVISDAKHGARFPERLVQIDLDPTTIGQHRLVEVGILGDAAAVLQALAERLPARAGAGSPEASWLDLDDFRKRKREWLAERTGPVLQICDDLRAALPRDTIFVDDLTLVGYWAPVLIEVYQPRTLIHAGTYGTLGYALPVAIGAKLACPRQPVVAICGDGGFLYTAQELATARAEGLDLVVLVFNDNAFGALQTYQDRVLEGRRMGSDLVNPDFVKLAEAFGIEGTRVQPDQLGPAVRRAVEAGGTWLIEIPFSPPQPYSVPPWMP